MVKSSPCPLSTRPGKDAAEKIIAIEQRHQEFERRILIDLDGAGTWLTMVLNIGASVPSRAVSIVARIAVAARWRRAPGNRAGRPTLLG